jgi:hypothetical protein
MFQFLAPPCRRAALPAIGSSSTIALQPAVSPYSGLGSIWRNRWPWGQGFQTLWAIRFIALRIPGLSGPMPSMRWLPQRWSR